MKQSVISNGSNKTEMKMNDLKYSLFIAPIGLVAGILAANFQASNLTEALKEQVIAQIGSASALIAITGIQVMILTFLSVFVGLKLARKTGLKLNLSLDRRGLAQAILFGFLSAFIISGADRLIFFRFLSNGTSGYSFSFQYFIMSLLYGGIIEELMIRFFLMSLVVYLIKKVLVNKNENRIPDWVYLISIAMTALIFAAGHLPATAQLLGLSVPIVIRAFVLNSIPGALFGYLYWKKGLFYAILAHMLTHVFNQLILFPILY